MKNLLLSLATSLSILPQLQAAGFNLQSLTLKDIRARALNGDAVAPQVKSLIPVEYRVEEGPGSNIPAYPPNLTPDHWDRLKDFLRNLEKRSPSLRQAPATRSQIERLLHGLKLIDRHYVNPIPEWRWDNILTIMQEVAAANAASGKSWNEIIDRMLAEGVSSLKDPHSAYLDPEQAAIWKNYKQGQSIGIGAMLTLDNQGLRVLLIYPNSGAEIAQLREQDIIIEVEGRPLEGLSDDDMEAIDQELSGREGTHAAIRILRNGRRLPDPIRVLRTRNKEPDVFKKMVSRRIGYLYIPHFTEAIDQVVFSRIRQLRQEGATSLVIDLRHNPGGGVHDVSSIASEFLQDGQDITSFRRKEVLSKRMITKGNGEFRDMPVAILIDRHSASGSEALAGALQDHRRATIIGSRSFGKGSQQNWLDADDERVLGITENLWYTPGGRNISAKPDPETGKEIPGTGGIIPDVIIAVPPDQNEQIMKQIYKESLGIPLPWNRAHDPVLKKAIDVLSGENIS